MENEFCGDAFVKSGDGKGAGGRAKRSSEEIGQEYICDLHFFAQWNMRTQSRPAAPSCGNGFVQRKKGGIGWMVYGY